MNYKNIKRIIDFLFAMVALPIAFIVVLILILPILIIDPGNPFYYQIRIGHRGKTFKVWKIRSMYTNSDILLHNYLISNPDMDLIWRTKFKLNNDPRVLPIIGHTIRAIGLDELPQILNILTGEMSLVGPRPLPQYHLARFNKDFISLRNNFKPGLTCLWQISPHRNDSKCLIQELDEFYINNISFWLDLKILYKTIIYCITFDQKK